MADGLAVHDGISRIARRLGSSKERKTPEMMVRASAGYRLRRRGLVMTADARQGKQPNAGTEGPGC